MKILLHFDCHLWLDTIEIRVILWFVAAIIKKWGYSFTWEKMTQNMRKVYKEAVQMK